MGVKRCGNCSRPHLSIYTEEWCRQNGVKNKAAMHALRPHATALGHKNFSGENSAPPPPRKSRKTPATEAQINYLRKLIDRLAQFDPKYSEVIRPAFDSAVQDEALGKAEASRTIETLKELLDKKEAEQLELVRQEQGERNRKLELVQNGLYCCEDFYFKVKRSKSSGYWYAEMLLDPEESGGKYEWSYEMGKGWVNKITPEMLLSAEEASAFGQETGTCVNCFRDLTAPESLRRGYGPVCAARHGWPYDTNAD